MRSIMESPSRLNASITRQAAISLFPCSSGGTSLELNAAPTEVVRLGTYDYNKLAFADDLLVLLRILEALIESPNSASKLSYSTEPMAKFLMLGIATMEEEPGNISWIS